MTARLPSHVPGVNPKVTPRKAKSEHGGIPDILRRVRLDNIRIPSDAELLDLSMRLLSGPTVNQYQLCPVGKGVR